MTKSLITLNFDTAILGNILHTQKFFKKSPPTKKKQKIPGSTLSKHFWPDELKQSQNFHPSKILDFAEIVSRKFKFCLKQEYKIFKKAV